MAFAGPTVRGAAADDFLVKVWGPDEGLPDSTVTSLAQTPDGYLWVGTLHGGLARFDGQRFVTFHPGNTPELRSIEIRKLLVDSQGTLWVNTVDASLISFRDGRFHFERQSTEAPAPWLFGVVSAGNNSVVLSSYWGLLFRGMLENGTNRWETIHPPVATLGISFCADQQGVIWYRTPDGKLGQVCSNQFVPMPDPPGLSSSQINTLITDPAGVIWAGTEKGLARWSGKLFVDMTPTNGEPDVPVRQMVACPDGTFWVWTDQGLRKCRGQQWVARVESWGGEEPVRAPTSTFNKSLKFFGDSYGGLWISHYGAGLWHVDAYGNAARVREALGLPNALVECWFEDREGNVWIGLKGGGLVRVQARIFHTVWPAESSGNLGANSICEDSSGAMWFGTSWKTLLRWRKGEFTSFTPPVYMAIDQAELINTVVFPGDADQLWVGTVQNGVLKLNHDEFSRPFPASDIGTVARVIYRDRRGRVWLGSEFGLYCWEQEKLKRFTLADGFSAAFVLAITEDLAGNVWIGTATGELWRYRDGQFTNYLPQDTLTDTQAVAGTRAVDSRFDPKRSAMVGGERFLTLHADDNQEGVIWIGTLGGGLLRFQKDMFTRFTMQQGLPSDSISQILEDGRGQLWLGTRGGIARVSKAALNPFADGKLKSNPFISFGKADGLPTVECSSDSQPACWRGRDDRLWFATVKGAVWVDPAKVPFNSVPPPVVIEEITVDGQRRVAAGSSGLEPSAHLPAHLEVSPGQHYFEFKFTALSLFSPDKVRFRWRLAGLEKDWGRDKNERSASYSFVPFGNYEFQVQACNNDGVWNETGAAIKLTVLPYFWQTWWFKVVSGGMGLAVILGSVLTVQHRRYRAKMQVLERRQALEQERTRIARDIHDQVGAKLTKIGKLTESLDRQSAVAAPHQPALRAVAETTHNLVQIMDEIVWAVNPRNDTLDNVVNYLVHYTEDFLGHTGVNCELKVPFEFPPAPVTTEVRHNLFMATQEALTNAVKHGRPTRVRLHMAMVGNRLTISLEDDGCGFSLGAKTVESNGLENMRQRIESVGGNFQLTSAPGGGTRIQFDVAVGGA